MRTSKTILLLLTVLGMGAYIWFYEVNQLSTAQKKALERQAFDLQVDQINRIGLRTPAYEVEMFKTDQGWELKEPKGARAATPVVRQLLARIKTLDKGELITPADIRAKEQSLAEFGLAVPRMKLSLSTPGKTRLYEVGDKNPLGNSLYVKEESTQNVMLVSTDLLEVLPENLLAFRDKTLFPLHFEEVQALDLISRTRTLRLEKRGGVWGVKTPVNAPADQEKVVAFIQRLLQSRIDGVVNKPSAEDLEAFQSSEHIVRVWSANSKVPIEIVVGGDQPLNPDQLLLRVAGQEGLVKVSKGMRNLAQSPVELFRDRSLFKLEADAVSGIGIEREGAKLRLEKTGNEWRVVEPVNMRASSARVQNMIKTWQNARVETFLEKDSGEKALTRVSFTSTRNGNPEQQSFGVLENAPLPGRALLRKSGEAGLLQVVPDLVKYAPVDLIPYLSREVLRFDPETAVRLNLVHGEETLGVIRTDAEQPWEALDGSWTVDQQKISDILESLSSIFAENLVELNPADLSKYGLDKPLIRISIGLAGDQAGNRTLLVSRPEADGPVLGILQGQNLVFQLSLADYDLVKNPLGKAE